MDEIVQPLSSCLEILITPTAVTSWLLYIELEMISVVLYRHKFQGQWALNEQILTPHSCSYINHINVGEARWNRDLRWGEIYSLADTLCFMEL